MVGPLCAALDARKGNLGHLFVKHPFDPTCMFTIIRLYCDQIGPRVH